MCTDKRVKATISISKKKLINVLLVAMEILRTKI